MNAYIAKNRPCRSADAEVRLAGCCLSLAGLVASSNGLHDDDDDDDDANQHWVMYIIEAS